ncbi:MAG: protein kinase [Planctomycetes bacterium]|nr:protein kinase [Planctomycetota bacterium]
MSRPDGPAGQPVKCDRCGTLTASSPSRSKVTSPATKRLGQYNLVRKLGEGGMGTVYEAVQDSLARRVALKVLNPKLMKNPIFLERFQREARAAAALNHPHLVMVYEIGEDQGYPFFSMEYVEGETLQRRIKREGRLALPDALSILTSVAEALDYAWTHGNIIHRDIKPDNIMIDRDGLVKLADMGLAKSTKEDVSLTMDGVGIGTPAYMSPEQGRGAKNVDCRADIYSVGITLFYALAGHRPFNGDTPLAIMMAHANQPLPDPRSLRPDLPASVNDLLQRMCAKKVEDRYANPAELLADLRALKRGEPVRPWTPAASAGMAASPSDQASGEPRAATGVPAEAAAASGTAVHAVSDAVAPARPVGRFSGLSVAAALLLLIAGLGFLFLGDSSVLRRAERHREQGTDPATLESPAAVPEDTARDPAAAGSMLPEEAVAASGGPGRVEPSPGKFEDVKPRGKRRPVESTPAGAEREAQEAARAAAVSEAWKNLQTRVNGHLGARHFGEALIAMDEVREDLRSSFPPDDLQRLRDSVYARADAELESLRQRAGQLASAGRFDDARSLYQETSDFGLLRIDEKVKAELAHLDELEAAAEKKEREAVEEAYERGRQEVYSLAKLRQYDAAMQKLDTARNDARFQPLSDRIAADQSDLQKARSVLLEALEGLRSHTGKPITVAGTKAVLQDVKDGNLVLSADRAQFSKPAAVLPAVELVEWASPGLSRLGGEGNLCLALFWCYEGEAVRAGRALEKAKQAGVDTVLYEAKVAGAGRPAGGDAGDRGGIDEGTGGEDGREGPEKVSKEDQERRQERVKLVQAIEKNLVKKSEEKWTAVLKQIDYKYRLIDTEEEVAPALRWQRINDFYKKNKRPFDKNYNKEKERFASAREMYDDSVYRAKKAQKESYERIHGNALKLIRRIRSGQGGDLDAERIEEILAGQAWNAE